MVAHSSGDLMRIDLYHGLYIQYDLIYAVRNLTVSCCAGGLCFCGGRKTRVHYVCSVLIARVGRWLIIFLLGRDYIFYLLHGECDERMRQEIKCSMLLSLRVQLCLLSSVEFLCLAWRNDAMWFLYLVLKSFSVSPMYVSVLLFSLRVTVAW